MERLPDVRHAATHTHPRRVALARGSSTPLRARSAGRAARLTAQPLVCVCVCMSASVRVRQPASEEDEEDEEEETLPALVDLNGHSIDDCPDLMAAVTSLSPPSLKIDR